MTDRIDPRRAGYAFTNGFVNVVATLPGGRQVRTAGRCGGMSYSVLDHLAAGRDAPSWPPALFAPARVPPDGHVVADHLRTRQLDSFRSGSALRFLTWSALPDGDVGPLAGVRRRTHRELAGVLRALAEGRPVVLGLVVARSVVRSGDNHQVVATGALRDPAGGVTLTVLDPNTPHREVTLVETPEGWRASNGRVWRGFFRHAYAPRAVPPLPSASRRPAERVRTGTPVALAHVATGLRLVVADGRPALRATGSTTWTPRGDDPASPGVPLADRTPVRLVAEGADGGPAALAVVDGDPALVPGHDGTAWQVVVEGGGPWREGSRVRLVDTRSGVLLCGDRSGLRTTCDPDAGTWWTVAEPV